MNCRRECARTRKSISGFTLLELLAVIAIIGLLASLALPAISRIRERARIGAVKAQLAHIETALSQYYTENDSFPAIGNDWLGGVFFPSEDVGRDGVGPFKWDNTLLIKRWVPNEPAYTGPDADGTEGNYELDPGEDIGYDLVPNDPYDSSPGIPTYFSDNDGNTITFVDAHGDTQPEYSIGEGNGRLDGTYYERLSLFGSEDVPALADIFGSKTSQYHYYAAYVFGKTDYDMPKFRAYNDLSDYQAEPPDYYNRWVIYSVGPDGRDHALHNYFLVMQSGEDVGKDAYASDPTDWDGDFILSEPSDGENNDSDDLLTPSEIQIRETRWSFTPTGNESGLNPAGTSQLDPPDGKPVFNYDVRQERRRNGQVYAMPDGDATAFGVIMRYGP